MDVKEGSNPDLRFILQKCRLHMQILWSNYFLVVYAFLDSVLLGSQNCNFKKMLLTFTKRMSLQLLFSLLGLFGSKIHAETGGKKKLPVVFLCAELTALLSLSLWFIVFVKAPISAELYVLRICYLHACKNRTTFNSTDTILQNAKDGVFCLIVEVHVWCEAQAFVIFQERSVPTFVPLLM